MHLTRPAKTKNTTESKSRKLILNTYLHERGKMLANAVFSSWPLRVWMCWVCSFYYYYRLLSIYISPGCRLLLLFWTVTIVFLTCRCVSDKILKDSSKNIVPVNASKSKCSAASLPDRDQFHGSARYWAQHFCVLNGSSPLFRKPTCKCSSFQPKGREQLPYCQTHFCSSGDVLIVLF